MSDVRFLLIDEVTGIHRLQLNLFGGSHGVRDLGLLDSALAAPQITFDGRFVHDSIQLMAAAYIFHIIKNHPFYDGNKRTGVLAGIIFLRRNGMRAQWTQEQMISLGISVALSELTIEQITELPFFCSESAS